MTKQRVALIRRLRRIIDEPKETTTYTDEDLSARFDEYSLPVGSSCPKSYDLNAVASLVWDEKAAALAANYDFSEEGGSYSRSQAYIHAKKQARYYAARAVYRIRGVARSVKLYKS